MNQITVIDNQIQNVGDYIAIKSDTTDEKLVSRWIGQKKSQHTKDQYRRVWDDIFQSFGGRIEEGKYIGGLPIQAWTLDHLQEWATFEGEEIAPSTKRLRINAIKSLLSFAQATGYTRFNIGTMLETEADNRNVKTKVVSTGDMDDLLDADTDAETKAILRVLYYGGMRVSEAVTIEWKNIEYAPDGVYLYLVGKGNKDRTIPLHTKAVKAIERISEDRTGYVFKSRRANKDGVRTHITRQYANKKIKSICEELKIDSSISAHWFRHTNATRNLEAGAPAHVVQDRLGHASLQTTTIYVHSGDNTQYI